MPKIGRLFFFFEREREVRERSERNLIRISNHPINIILPTRNLQLFAQNEFLEFGKYNTYNIFEYER